MKRGPPRRTAMLSRGVHARPGRIQQLPDFGGQNFRGKRLTNATHAWSCQNGLARRFPQMPGREEHSQIGLPRPELPCQLRAIHPGHLDIGYQQVDRPGVALGQCPGHRRLLRPSHFSGSFRRGAGYRFSRNSTFFRRVAELNGFCSTSHLSHSACLRSVRRSAMMRILVAGLSGRVPTPQVQAGASAEIERHNRRRRARDSPRPASRRGLVGRSAALYSDLVRGIPRWRNAGARRVPLRRRLSGCSRGGGCSRSSRG